MAIQPLFQKTRKISNKQPTLTPNENRETKPEVSRRKHKDQGKNKENMDKTIKKKSMKLKAGSLKTKRKLIKLQPKSSIKKRKMLKSIKLETKRENLQLTPQK